MILIKQRKAAFLVFNNTNYQQMKNEEEEMKKMKMTCGVPYSEFVLCI